MSSNIERVRYYDGEYLRSFDFTAEQTYHLEMRRRLNLALHLWGIVDGLELKGSDEAAGIPVAYVTPGLAIDAYGREIVLFTAYPISDEVLYGNNAWQDGTYSVWARYARRAGTPPAPGYRTCRPEEQYTRWV